MLYILENELLSLSVKVGEGEGIIMGGGGKSEARRNGNF